MNDDINRREFLSLMAASVALAGAGGCASTKPEYIVPYVRMPENVLPGNPLSFATAMQTSGYGVGLIVESHEGRPIKVEGNPGHPASLGATDAFAQASLLTLYDPERAQTVSNAGQISTWDAFVTMLQSRLQPLAINGAGLRILTETVTSPSITDLMTQVLAKFPGSRWYQYEPVNRDNARSGARMGFGKYVDVQYRFNDADVIVALDSDFLSAEPAKLRYAREFARRRKTSPGENKMNRMYAIESTPSITGAMAEHRFPLRSSDIGKVARALATQTPSPGLPWIPSLRTDLDQHRGRSIVIAGEGQPPEVHALVHRLNETLGNVGATVFYTDPVEPQPMEQMEGLRQLSEDIAAKRVEVLIVIGGNPAYTAPADLDFASRLAETPMTAHLSLHYDETAALCRWHIPESHYLESWGDVRAYDGTVSIVQPLLVPLYQTRTSHELLAAVLGNPTRSNRELVLDYWTKQRPEPDFESFWNAALRDGFIANTQAPQISVTTSFDDSTEFRQTNADGLEIVFRPDPCVFDGRWANNAWLQELPKPLTQLVWDNAALMSPGTASKRGIENEDVIVVEHNGRSVDAAAWILPGHADESVTLHFGYGRKNAGQVGSGRGFDAFAVRTSAAPWIATGASIRKANRKYPLVTTQKHHELTGRHIVRHTTQQHYADEPRFAQEAVETPSPDLTLYPSWENIDYAWGMAVDLSTCIGCNACVVACQAENNIPVVGKDEVANSREMHWIRIDTYRAGDAANLDVFFQPMLCQHCENAPCELVCPVEATSHSAEGLNEMTYNRCVGTRYCSNNCPYKVRRFNFFQYTEWDIPQLKMLYNPDVTVRSRGVMEKCTYCVQRINRARIDAKKEDRKIRDGEVVTACQAACPAEAIVFGNIQDPNSQVSKVKSEPRNYGVLAELNTRPRTTYLAKITNPNSGILEA